MRKRRAQLPPTGRLLFYGPLSGTSESWRGGSLAAAIADDLLAKRASDLTRKEPVTLTFAPPNLLIRLTLARRVFREVDRRLQESGYILSKRDRGGWSFVYDTRSQ